MSRRRYILENREGENSNRLLQEKSPYLLQHVHNHSDWYPWGEEASIDEMFV
ncbi:DUF255 domain-containing protein [Paenibacillus sp. FSL L8-0470]|uniref:DUF255 domain-containing protein n=1 Tax=Paenibacillus sp. FSL L8-0470 TaxID=2954688 RepID=UPI0030F743A7